MKCLFPVAVWLAVGFGIAAPASAVAQPLTARINDTGYVRLSEWARWQGLSWRWLKRDESFQLTNRTTRLQFVVDSREARVNGLQIWLLYPLASRDGSLYISQLDVDATFRPLLSPAPPEAAKKIKTICLDPGHGGRDPGNRLPGRQEKDYTLRLAFELRDQLKQAGFKVMFTRSSDEFIELSERPERARRAGANLFVSLHFNATEGGRAEARGSEVYCLTPVGAASTNARGEGARSGAFPGNRNNGRNILLAYQIQKSLIRTLQSGDRGVRRARFEVLRGATMPAVLIEAGFLSHPEEGKRIFTAEYRRQIARAITEGIQSFKKIVER
jgi:N-acetylmuramoyl-L-alanine amidase